MKPVEDSIVAGVDDYGQIVGRKRLGESQDKLRAADPPGKGKDCSGHSPSREFPACFGCWKR